MNPTDIQEMDEYLNVKLPVKREKSPVYDYMPKELSAAQKALIIKEYSTAKGGNRPTPPSTPITVEVKQEPLSGGSSSPSPPLTRISDLPSTSTVIAQAYTHQGYDGLAPQYISSPPLQFQIESGETYMLTPPDYRGLPDYYTAEHLRRHNLAAATVTTGSGYTDTTNTASFVDLYIHQTTGYKSRIQGLAVDIPSPDSGIGENAITSRDTNSLPQVS